MDHSVKSRLHVTEMLESILAQGHVVLIGYSEGIYSASMSGRALGKNSATKTMESCIEELTDHPRRKVCIRDGCKFEGRPTNLGNFGPDRDSADGHSNVCHNCESTRVKKIGKKRMNPPKSEGNGP